MCFGFLFVKKKPKKIAPTTTAVPGKKSLETIPEEESTSG